MRTNSIAASRTPARWTRSAPRPADRGVAHGLRYLPQHRDFLRHRSERLFIDQALQRFLLAYHADAARDALAAGFMAKETGDAQQDATEVNRLIKQHDHAGAKTGADGASVFEGERVIQLVWSDKRPGRAPQKNRLQLAVAGYAAGKINQLAQRRSHRNFIEARTRHVSGETKQPGTGGVFRAELGIIGAAFEDDAGNVDECFDVVNGGGLSEKSGLRGERRLVARLAAIAFDRVEQCGLFAADVRAGAAANFKGEFEAAAKNVVAEEAVFGGSSMASCTRSAASGYSPRR